MGLVQHCRSAKHSDEWCDECRWLFVNNDARSNHIRSSDRHENQCEECLEKFKNDNNLRMVCVPVLIGFTKADDSIAPTSPWTSIKRVLRVWQKIQTRLWNFWPSRMGCLHFRHILCRCWQVGLWMLPITILHKWLQRWLQILLSEPKVWGEFQVYQCSTKA